MTEIESLRIRCPYCKSTSFEMVIQAHHLKAYWDHHGTKKIEVYWCWSCEARWHFKKPD
jgi:hypothetical protein